MPHAARTSLCPALFVSVLLSVAAVVPAAGQELPREDLDFLVEHMLELTMDNRFASMPASAEAFERGRWQGGVDVGGGSAAATSFDVGGRLVAVMAGLGVAERRGVEMSAFFDRASISGGGGEQALRPLWSQAIPLDLPQRAEITGLDSRVTSWGLGASYVWQRAPAPTGRRWTWRAGALYDRLEARAVRTHFRLVAGASAGAEGELDYSATYSYLVPFGEAEVRWPLGARWEIAPHFGFYHPLPRRGFAGRIGGPGFEIEGDTGESLGKKHMGDPYLALGVRLDDRRTGFGVDLGATVFQALTEGISHPGIGQELLVQLCWHPPRHSSAGEVPADGVRREVPRPAR